MPILQDSLQNAQAGAPAPVGAAATAPQNVPGAAATALPPPNPAITCPAVKAHMGAVANMRKIMGPQLGNAYDRIVVAGRKMLYAPESAETVKKILTDDQIPLKNKLGEGVANLMVMMDNTANGTMPKEALVPAGITIMFEAADYAFERDIPVSEKDLADSMEILVYGIYSGYQIPPEKVDELLDKLAGQFGFKEGDADKVMEKVEGAQEEGKVREPIPGETEEEMAEGAGDNPQEEEAEAAFTQGFNKTRGV
jgi:hypothetical protein